jgi:hypothetical protein
MVTRIVIDAGRVYVAYGGYRSGNIRYRDEKGQWQTLGSQLPPVPIRSLAVHPAQRESLYVGTDLGLFCSDDQGQTWFATSEGPCSVRVEDLFWVKATLYAVTHGRGLYRVDLARATR